MATIGGEFDGGAGKQALRALFLDAVDRVLPKVRQEAKELGVYVRYIGATDESPIGLSPQAIALLRQGWQGTYPRTPEDIPPDSFDTWEPWREILANLDQWRGRWNAFRWMWTAGLWSALCAAKGWTVGTWSAEWNVLRTIMPPPVYAEAPVRGGGSLDLWADLTRETKAQARERLKMQAEREIEAFLAWAEATAEGAGIARTKEIRERDSDLGMRLEWTALRRIRRQTKERSYEWIARWTQDNRRWPAGNPSTYSIQSAVEKLLPSLED